MAIASVEFSYQEKQKLDRTFEVIKKEIPAATYEALVAFLFNVKSLAQNRLKDRKHIVTSRLRNSIYVQSTAKRQDNKTYSDKRGNSFNGEINVPLKKHEAAVGTNVEYALSVERGSAPHMIRPTKAKVLSWMPKAAGEAWFTGKTRSTLRKFYSDGKGGFKLKKERIFAAFVNHPGTQGDSYLWWAFQRADDKEFVKEYNRQVNMIKKKIQ
jgi:hypothetical protein